MKQFFSVLLLALSVSVVAERVPLQQFKLDNGLTIYLWEDKNQPDVTGRVVVRAGSIDEPEEYTGLAHYLEHVLFKGTEKIGALDWAKEKPLYEQIIKLYDEYAEEKDPVKRDTLTARINRLSLEAANYTVTSDFSNLIEGMGGENLNAGTSYDMTVYYNNFPAYQMEKWLEVNSERLMNPVFRAFQAELENVFEEYNMYQDSRNTHVSNFMFSNLYPTHAYGRDIIGNPEHLKNPRLSKLIEFYNTWYVPSNMALVLVGNFNSNEVIPMVKAKFGRLHDKPVPERKKFQPADFSKKVKVSAKLSYSPQVIWGYQGVKKGHPDELALDICMQLLSNSRQTGLLDKLSLDGDVSGAAAINDVRRDEGRLLLMAVPYYDISQRMYSSDKATEALVMKEVDKVKNGLIEDWLIKSVKDDLLQQYKLIMETPSAKTEVLTELFTYQLPDDYFFGMVQRVESITKEELQRVAKQYLSGNNITISILEGKPKKNKLKKPAIKPLDQPKGKTTEYSKWIHSLPVNPVAEVYNDFAAVKVLPLYEGIPMHYTRNELNDVFTMTIRYGVGTKKMPKLEYAVELMNSAGIMPSDDAQTVRRRFSELNVRSSYAVDDNYFYITMRGDEKNLVEACKLMTRQTLLPKLDEKQLDRVKGSQISYRLSIEPNDINVQSDALLNYIMYKDESEYIDRPKLEEVYFMKISELTGEIIRASDYEVEVHYVGTREPVEVAGILKANLPFKEELKKSESPVVQERITYEKPTIHFLRNSDAQQVKLYFYINGSEFKPEDQVLYDAFYQYFSGGFNGLVMNEIRENNSMAYTAYGALVTPPVADKKAYFMGYVGTQGDKAADAIDLYMKLLKDMPLYPDRITNVKTYLKQSYLTDKPSFRSRSQVFNRWKMLGYTDDPAKVNMAKVENLTFEQIVEFYNREIKGKPITIIMTGDPKMINLKQIEAAHGKISNVSASGLFTKL
jgi:predicted Zn-dependent peptidase